MSQLVLVIRRRPGGEPVTSDGSSRQLQAASDRDGVVSGQGDGPEASDTGLDGTEYAVLPVDPGSEGLELLLALADEDCQAILEATAEVALSAPELADRCDIARSTAYRKIDTLTRLGLVEEDTRLRPGGGDVSEYTHVAGNVVVRISQTGAVKLQHTRKAGPAALRATESVTSD